MDHDLHTQLMKTLQKVPLAQTYDGRTALLAGIPGISSIKRNSSIDYADLALLINQLADLRLQSGTWALSIFLDNAIMSVSGFIIEVELKSLKVRFEAYKRDTKQRVNQHPPASHSPLPSSAIQPQRTDEVRTFENKQAFAVIIGIAGYPNVSQLSDVVLKDARDIRSLLRSPEYCGYLESNVKLLPDKKATADAIRDSFRWLAKAATPESTAFIYFSGHGLRLQTDSQTIHYLLPYNYDPTNMEKTAISGEELTRLLNAIKTQRLLVIFDCCHSGGTGETKAAETVETLKVAGKEFKSGLEEQYLAQLAKGTGRVIMASSRPDEPAYILPGMDNSLFTHYLLEALRGTAFTRGDGLIRVFDVFDYVAEKVPTRRPQHPLFKAEVENNFPIALYQGGQKMDLSKNLSLRQNTEVDRTALREAMVGAFSRAELEILCADVQQALLNDGIRERVSLDVVGGANEGTENVIYKLIEHLDRRNYLGYLVQIVRHKRPGII